jgi:hypothetical protein
MIVGVLYSAVCDASCSLYGCALLLQEIAPKDNDPHAHCHSRGEEGSERADKLHGPARSDVPQRQNGDDSPECASHLYASALIPRAACGQVTWDAHAVIFESPQIAPARIPNQSADSAKLASFRSPPDLAMLSVLRV